MTRAKSPPKYAVIKRLALSLPGASEVIYRGYWFNVGTKTFVCSGFMDERWIFKLPKDMQEIYFEARGETFQPMRAGALLWSTVAIENLGNAEIKHLVTAAWRMVAPKKPRRELIDMVHPPSKEGNARDTKKAQRTPKTS